MAKKYKHIILPLYTGDFTRRTRGGGGYNPPSRDRSTYYTTEIEMLNVLKRNQEKREEDYAEYLDPNLIFKIMVNQSVGEERFKADLRRMGIDIIAASPKSQGYWIAFSDDKEFKDFKIKLKKYSDEDAYKVFNAIDGVKDIPPEEKEGESISKSPFAENEVSNLDLEIWRMEDEKLEDFIQGLRRLIEGRGGELTDILTTTNFCLLRVKVNFDLYHKILELREVASVERPPRVRIETALQTNIDSLNVDKKPGED